MEAMKTSTVTRPHHVKYYDLRFSTGDVSDDPCIEAMYQSSFDQLLEDIRT